MNYFKYEYLVQSKKIHPEGHREAYLQQVYMATAVGGNYGWKQLLHFCTCANANALTFESTAATLKQVQVGWSIVSVCTSASGQTCPGEEGLRPPSPGRLSGPARDAGGSPGNRPVLGR